MKYLAVSRKMRTFASDYKANLRIMRIVHAMSLRGSNCTLKAVKVGSHP